MRVDAFASDLRGGGYEGRITVGDDLTRITLGSGFSEAS
jgi:hypothetical protein